jgi:hypothetical protein
MILIHYLRALRCGAFKLLARPLWFAKSPSRRKSRSPQKSQESRVDFCNQYSCCNSPTASGDPVPHRNSRPGKMSDFERRYHPLLRSDFCYGHYAPAVLPKNNIRRHAVISPGTIPTSRVVRIWYLCLESSWLYSSTRSPSSTV